MNSSHTKIVLLITFSLLCALAAGLLILRQLGAKHRLPPNLQGFWEGTMEVKDIQLRLVLKVERTPGGYTATMDSVDQGAKDIPITTFAQSNHTVWIVLPQLRVNFQGEANAAATEISGEWRQAGRGMPITFKKTAKPSTIAGPLPAAAYARRAQAPLQGHWKGTIITGPASLRLRFKITEASPGQFRGTMDSLDQGARDFPLSSVEFAAPTARWEIASIGGQFEGALQNDDMEIDGLWRQAGRDFKLLLKRADPLEEEVPVSDDAYAFVSDTELPGLWQGTLDANGTLLRLLFKIGKASDGSYRAAMDSLDQGAKNIPATSVSFTNGNVKLEWKAMRALFHGQLENGRLTGFWQQGAGDFPLDLERTNRTAAARAP